MDIKNGVQWCPVVYHLLAFTSRKWAHGDLDIFQTKTVCFQFFIAILDRQKGSYKFSPVCLFVCSSVTHFSRNMFITFFWNFPESWAPTDNFHVFFQKIRILPKMPKLCPIWAMTSFKMASFTLHIFCSK